MAPKHLSKIKKRQKKDTMPLVNAFTCKTHRKTALNVQKMSHNRVEFNHKEQFRGTGLKLKLPLELDLNHMWLNIIFNIR